MGGVNLAFLAEKASISMMTHSVVSGINPEQVRPLCVRFFYSESLLWSRAAEARPRAPFRLRPRTWSLIQARLSRAFRERALASRGWLLACPQVSSRAPVLRSAGILLAASA